MKRFSEDLTLSCEYPNHTVWGITLPWRGLATRTAIGFHRRDAWKILTDFLLILGAFTTIRTVVGAPGANHIRAFPNECSEFAFSFKAVNTLKVFGKSRNQRGEDAYSRSRGPNTFLEHNENVPCIESTFPKTDI